MGCRAPCSLHLPPPAVPQAPSITADPSAVILPFPGGTAAFACSFTGHPTPSIEWLHNEVTVRAGMRVSVSVVGLESQLTVESAVEADTGNYQCIANNSLGQDSSQIASLTIASALTEDYWTSGPVSHSRAEMPLPPSPPSCPSLLPLPLQALAQTSCSLRQTRKLFCPSMSQFPVHHRRAHHQPM